RSTVYAMFGSPQSRNCKNRYVFLRVANKGELAAIGRPGWATVARISRDLQGLIPSYHRRKNSCVPRAVTLTECHQRAVGGERGCGLEAAQTDPGHYFDALQLCFGTSSVS